REHDPRCPGGEPRSPDGPALPRLELSAGAGVVPQELRERAQETAKVGAADVARDAQGLDDPIGDRVGEASLEQVEALGEPARRAVVLGEAGEGLAQLLGPTVAELGDRLGVRAARTPPR